MVEPPEGIGEKARPTMIDALMWRRKRFRGGIEREGVAETT
jgi:hypothetical protein